MQITDLNNTIKKEHDFKINELNGSSTLWKKDIYIVKRSHNWYKIGVSNNVNNRMRTIQGYSPEKITFVASVPLQGMVYYIERKVLETFRKYLSTQETLRRKYRADNKAIEKLITNYKPTYNAISILK